MTGDGTAAPVEGVKTEQKTPRDDQARYGMSSATPSARRHAATEVHLLAVTEINVMFDRFDDLIAARAGLTGTASRQLDDDPIHDAEMLLEHARRLREAVERLRSAAQAASVHRTRGELATDLGTKIRTLFPRQARQLSRTEQAAHDALALRPVVDAAAPEAT